MQKARAAWVSLFVILHEESHAIIKTYIPTSSKQAQAFMNIILTMSAFHLFWRWAIFSYAAHTVAKTFISKAHAGNKDFCFGDLRVV